METLHMVYPPTTLVKFKTGSLDTLYRVYLSKTWLPSRVSYPETPFSAQPGEDYDYKLPPSHYGKHGQFQLSAGNGYYFDPTPLSELRVNTIEKWIQSLNEGKVEQNAKLKAQEEEIEKLQKMVNERDKKIRMYEKKERAHLKKRKGKNPFGLRSRVKNRGFCTFLFHILLVS
jgi:hypothetical protein